MTRKISLLFLVCMMILLPLASCSKPKTSEVSTKKSASKGSSSVSSFKGLHDSLWTLKAGNPFLIGGYGDNFNYDGSNVSPMFGKAMVKLDAERDTGTMVVKLKGTINPQKGKSYTGDITIYYKLDKGGPDYREGGVADFIYLHGDTKQGPPLMPKLRTYLAAWGSADVYVNDKLVYQNLDGHMMLTERSRDTRTRAIYNKDKSGFYSPNDPANASIADPDSQELHFVAHSTKADKKNSPPHTVWIHINFEDVTDMSGVGPAAAMTGKPYAGLPGHDCPHHSRGGARHGMHGYMHGKHGCAHAGGMCMGDCDCGCKEGKPCAMVDGKCSGNCGCGCAEGESCAMTGAICAPGCDCGCNEGKPCTCSAGKCGPGCDCGCNDGKPCTCAHAAGMCMGDCDCGCKEGKPCAMVDGKCSGKCGCGCAEGESCAMTGKPHAGLPGHDCPHHSRGGAGHGMHGYMHGKHGCGHAGGMCMGDCDCGCKEGKPCTCPKHTGKCGPGCGCGCAETGVCTLKGGNCGDGCKCGCVEGKPCNTSSDEVTQGVCGAGCGCGCHETGICAMDGDMCKAGCGCGCHTGKACDMVDKSRKDSEASESKQTKPAI